MSHMKIKIWFFIFILFWSCKTKYMPNIHYPASGFLVVEGFINAGSGPTTISLHRTSPLDSITEVPETGAQVAVVSEQGVSFSLLETGSGNYSIDQIPIDSNQKYRIQINTSNGKEYLSDLSDVNISPPIDTVEWKAGSDNVSIYVSTHDSQNKNKYYEWNFEETWIYNAAYFSAYRYTPQGIVPRQLAEADSLYICWDNSLSTVINIASTQNLSTDVIYQFPLQTISYYTSNRLINRYSILVKQIVLSKAWYEWKQELKRNTEQLGSIFDAQPSETGGNITCTTDPTERVVGFVGCTSQTESRIFIDRSQFSPLIHIFSGYENCTIDSILVKDADRDFASGSELILYPYGPPGVVDGYTGANGECVVCTLHGGTNAKPDFWY
jgi:Domain of unknown function (DUF4249)